MVRGEWCESDLIWGHAIPLYHFEIYIHSYETKLLSIWTTGECHTPCTSLLRKKFCAQISQKKNVTWSVFQAWPFGKSAQTCKITTIHPPCSFHKSTNGRNDKTIDISSCLIEGERPLTIWKFAKSAVYEISRSRIGQHGVAFRVLNHAERPAIQHQ